ncbi:hypothetical protein GGI04_000402 [Coemansia thaxteri]|uniref:Peptidase M24 domain-containing protein n=1 Tax=Coemansia thaxteri TaxID=2663907 RepID=A0A9W8EDV4_9FUNG|nr:hypothetical protein H4R26_004599 [Coemansia thaxteri]KAJ2009492.1 hypothetical protein GGI04_000402 [Coemansia thaxteri]KAJ2473857.1 hypothetical protein GGI02_000535 [Coemansia sp. RSA 2322]KAJ2479625.1 hypothetical protein EV174_003968 [Coemansia sp. RSA 2320]
MDPEINPKYQSSAAIAEQVLKHVLSSVVPGMSIAALCSYANSLVAAYSKSVYRKEEGIERGASLPATVSVNNIIQNCSPSSAEDCLLREGDVVKVEVGVHIDGYIASAAHTTIASNNPALTITDRRADAISAAYYASEVAVRMIRPGQTARNLIKAMGLVATGFNCAVAEDTFTCQIDRFVMSGANTFANRFNPDILAPELTFETGEIYTIDCTLSTGDGIARASTYDPAIYQRDVNHQYSLKLRTSRSLFSEVCKRYSVFPFLMRDVVTGNQAFKAGVNECVRSQLLVPFAVTIDKRHGSTFVAQFKLTVMCHYSGPIRLTPALPMPNVQSATTIPEASEIGQILALDCGKAPLPDLPRLKTQIQAPVPTQPGANGCSGGQPSAMDTDN